MKHYLKLFEHIDHIVKICRKFNECKLPAGMVEDKFSYVATFDEIIGEKATIGKIPIVQMEGEI